MPSCSSAVCDRQVFLRSPGFADVMSWWHGGQWEPSSSFQWAKLVIRLLWWAFIFRVFEQPREGREDFRPTKDSVIFGQFCGARGTIFNDRVIEPIYFSKVQVVSAPVHTDYRQKDVKLLSGFIFYVTTVKYFLNKITGCLIYTSPL